MFLPAPRDFASIGTSSNSDGYELDWSNGNGYQVGIIILSFMFFPIKNLEFVRSFYYNYVFSGKKNLEFLKKLTLHYRAIENQD